jgi:hypothetical protein
MNCISLNCRGAGNFATIRELGVLQRTHQAKIMFLCETRQSSAQMKKLRTRLGLRGFTSIDSNGNSGGLALFWHESIYVEVKDACDRYIDVWMRLSPDEPLFHATFMVNPEARIGTVCGINSQTYAPRPHCPGLW